MGVNKPFVITIVGAESSGKTTLATQLAEYFKCAWVPEYARNYLEKINRQYELKDLEEIGRGQLRLLEEGIAKIGDPSDVSRESSIVSGESSVVSGELSVVSGESSDVIRETSDVRRESSVVSGESSIVSSESSIVKREPLGVSRELLELILSKNENPFSGFLIVDGGMLNMKMWAKIKFNERIPFVEEALASDVTNLYLLCRPHKEWAPDPLREAPSVLERAWIYNQYLEELSRNQVLFEIVRSR